MEQIQKHRSLLALGLVLLFLVLFAFYMFMVVPSSDSIGARDQEIMTLERQNEILQKKLAEKKNEVQNSSEDALQAQLPLWDNTEQLLLDLGNISQATHTENVSFNFTIDQASADNTSASSTSSAVGEDKSNATDAVSKLQVAAVIKGKYDDILAYVTGLQNLQRVIAMNTLDISNTVCACGIDQTLTVNLTFTAYFDPSYKDKVSKIEYPYAESSATTS